MRQCRLATLALLCASTATRLYAQPFPERDLPPTLQPWARWVLDDVKDYRCAITAGQRVCVWPGRLQFDLGAAGGTFTLDVQAENDADLGLPGDALRWPQDVRVDGAPAAVFAPGELPTLRLAPGTHHVAGRFAWRQLPDSLPVPKPTAIVDLTVDGHRVALPQREEDGLLWLRRGAGRAGGEGESLRVQAFRKLQDGIPLFLDTNLLLEVSGKAREIELQGALVESAVAVAVSGDLPAQVESNGRLRVQVRAGRFRVSLLSRLAGSPKAVAAPHAPEPWPASEIWVFEADELLRQVQVSGGQPIEPGRTDLPEEWRSLPAFGLESGAALTFDELRRGEAAAPPDKLTLQRELWLDQDGRAFTVRDVLKGALSRTWRLELLPPGQLGRVAVGGKDQLVTEGGNKQTGVELRTGALDATADSRLARGGALPAVGWSADVESLGARLHLPPGWRLVGGTGVDHLPDSWIGRWTLLGFFFVLLVAFGVGRLLGWRLGVLALFAVGLSYHEPGAPFLSWLSLLGACALLHVAPEGRLRRFAQLWRGVSLLVLVFVLLPFLRDEVRGAIFPQVMGAGVDAGNFQFAKRAYAPQAEESVTEGGVVDGMNGDAAAPAAAPAAPPPSKERSATFAARDESKLYLATTLSSNSSANMAQDPHAVNQTGPGVPTWSWQDVHLEWSGPVARDHRLRLFLLSPGASGVLTFLRLGLLLSLFSWLAGGRKTPPAPATSPTPEPEGQTNSDPLSHGTTLALVLALGLCGARLEAQEPQQNAHEPEAPSASLLEELKTRLTRPDACQPNCITSAQLTLRIADERLAFSAEVHAAAAGAWALPGPTSSWTPDDVRVDGKASAAVVRLEDGFLRVRLAAGVHRVEVTGSLPRGDGLTLQLKDRPHRAQVDAPGWDVVGLREDGLSDESIQISRRLAAGHAATAAEGHYAPWLQVERTLEVGVSWRVVTNVRRVSPVGAPIAVRIPLLPGESPTEGGLEMHGGAVSLALSRDQTEATWSSSLAMADELTLAAPEGQPWSEAWHVQCGVVWQCVAEGLVPVSHQTEGQYAPAFRPWPGETLKLTFHRPAGAPGQTLTLDAVTVLLKPGTRLETAAMSMRTRASREEILTLTLPAGADVQKVAVDSVARPVRPDAGKLKLSLPTGAHLVLVEWHLPSGLGPFYSGAPVGLSVPAVNAKVSVTLPEDRWLLFTRGPAWGPAVLFWGYLLVVVAVAVGLGRLPSSPLRVMEWVLLALGLTQLSPLAVFLVAAFFFAIVWRQSRPLQRPWLFDLVQIGLVIWTLIVLACLYGVVETGLLLRPDMQVAGNGSSATALEWYADRVAASTPAVSVVSLPLWMWRATMLLWSLWLAASLVRWAGWAWRGWTEGGVWRPLWKRRVRTSPPPLPPTEGPSAPAV